MSILKVPVTKGKGFVEIETDEIPAAVYAEAMLQGLKVLVNRGMTKVTKEAYPEEADLRAAAMEKAAEAVENIKAGKVRIMGAKADRVSGAVMTEARRIARLMVKDEMKKANIKVSYVEAAEITKAANSLLAIDTSIIEQAKANIEARSATRIAVDVTAIPISEKKKAAAEKAKASKKVTLSATKAGQTTKRKSATHANA